MPNRLHARLFTSAVGAVHAKLGAFVRCCLATGLLAFTFTGCGESSDTVSVHGTATYQGEAIPRGSVSFFPNQGRPVNAPLSSDGGYEAELKPGDYVVTVRYSEGAPPGYKEGDPLPPPKIQLPNKYTIPVQSELHATVSPDQSEPIDFALE